MNKLNANEALVGAIYGLCFAFKVGWWAVLLSFACGLLWALGGTVNKLYRRIGCALLPTLTVFIHAQDGTGTLNLWPLLSFPLAFAVLSMGYGVPTYAPDKPDTITDEGSWLGRFYQNIYFRMEHSGAPISGRDGFVNFWTRSTIYLLLALAFLPVWLA